MPSCGDDRKYFFLAVNTGFADRGLPDARCVEFYARRSGNGLHCAIVGNVVTPGGFESNDVCTRISSDGAWQDLAEGIRARGAVAGVQLCSAWRGYQGMRRFVPRRGEHAIAEYEAIARSISSSDVVDAFATLNRGTELAVAAGFKHVQLHAAHGYLFNLLIDRRFSSHADLAAKLVQQWATDADRMNLETSVRFSLWTGHKATDELRALELVDDLAAMPIDYLDVSAGFYNIDKRLIYPSTADLIAQRGEATLALAARHPETSFILSGKAFRAWDPSLPMNVHIGVCRDLIANPDFLRDRLDGCMNCMKCHYFSRGAAYLTCGRWSAGPTPSETSP
jgi:2,4-dienoyl-CoA reductase-like NADH-dependent reductase (Old Yellow Enzyme family)